MNSVNENEKRPLLNHLAIIMDGNGRWAQMRGLPRTAGHQAGVQAVRRAIETCHELGFPILTLYTFSTENWHRPAAEVEALMGMVEEYAVRELPELQRNGIRLQFMGQRENLPATLLAVMDTASCQTQANSRLVLNLAFNYGGRTEIVDAIKAILIAQKQGTLNASRLNEETFPRYLYCPDCPDADMVIRTGGEWRLSNFLLWRSAEAVFWSTPVLWPDFQREHLIEAIEVYREQIVIHNENTRVA